MALPIAVLVVGSLSAVAVVGGLVGYVSYGGQSKSRWVSQMRRNVTLRGGVTAVSPFHSDRSSTNILGMVEVFPRSQALKSAQVPAVSPPIMSDSQSTDNTPVSTDFNPPEEMTIEPFELSDPIHPSERARCRRLYSQGMTQTKLISEVWGISKGGSQKYYEARRRFRDHVADIAADDLRASIEAERVTVNA